MNDHDHDHATPATPDAELAATARLLDALGHAEAESAPAGLEASVFAASRMRLLATPPDLIAIAGDVDALARQESLRGAENLEQQAFELSREAVASGRFVPPAHERAQPMRLYAPVLRHWSRAARLGLALRVAAGLLLLVGASVTVSRLWPGTQQVVVAPQPEPTAAELASRISTEMDALFETMTLDGSRDDVSLETTRENDWDANWVDELFSQESL
jgi:hypothetical protein